MKLVQAIITVSLLALSSPLLFACAVDSKAESENLGTVRMNLTGTSVDGTIYRLRSAQFRIDGPTATVLSSETNPDLTVLSTDLAPGDYTSTLDSGWYLERLDGGSTFVPVDANLLSANPAAFSIQPGTGTNLVYQFATNGTIVTIGDGSLQISIDVIETGAPGCVIFDDSTCAASEWCTPTDLEGGSVCIASGPVPFGGACAAQNDCQAGSLCGDLGAGPVCVELCNFTDLFCESGSCNDIGTPTFGVCF